MPFTEPFPGENTKASHGNASTGEVRQSAGRGEGALLSQRVARRGLYKPAIMIAAAAAVPAMAAGATPTATASDLDGEVRKLEPEIERYVTSGMAAFDVPGAAIGIVAGDRLIYAKDFGKRRKGDDEAVDTASVFQIGSATKAFLSAMLALAVDRKKLKWDDRVAALYPSFALEDPWVTREFRVFDLTAQRSGLPPYANDVLSDLGFGPDRLIHSLRFVAPTASFRSRFTYTNITHLLGGRIAASALGAPDWPTLARNEILAPLGMRNTSFTAEAIEKAPDHAVGHRWTQNGSVAIPFTPLFPYQFGPAGDINSTVEDCARWVRLQLGSGSFAGRRLVSAENLAMTRTPQVSISETVAYAMGWIVVDTPNGRVVWHNGGTSGFGAMIGFVPQKGAGVIVLTNQGNVGFPDALGLWILDKLLGNPATDHVAAALSRLKEKAAQDAVRFRKPANPRPAPAPESLAGEYRSDTLGTANLAATNDGLLLTLEDTGARLRLVAFDGALFTVRLVPEGRFAPVAAAQGDTPMGFAGFEADPNGHLSRLRWWGDNGQAFLWTKA